jgi:hypothetical protein
MLIEAVVMVGRCWFLGGGAADVLRVISVRFEHGLDV